MQGKEASHIGKEPDIMKNSRQDVYARQMNLLNMVRERGEIRVDEIARELQISTMTVRRDLQYLDDEKLLRRTHGGAVSFEQEKRKNIEDLAHCRERISAYAARYVEDGETIFINGSRTALGILKYLEGKTITAYTNNGWAILEDYPKEITVRLTGGELYSHIMTGEYVVRNILDTDADRAIFGCAAVYDDGQFRYDIPTEIGINEAMIGRTRKQLYVLADHSKLQRQDNRIHSYGSCTYNRSCILITDELADPDIVNRLVKLGIEVVQVPLV